MKRNFNEILRDFLDENNLTQVAFAKTIGIKQSQVSEWLKGKAKPGYDILKQMDITFGNRMKMQLEIFVPVYVECGGTKKEAIDYFLAHKILRKLEGTYESYILSSLKELYEYLQKEYPKTNNSIKKIERIKKKNFGLEEGKWN